MFLSMQSDSVNLSVSAYCRGKTMTDEDNPTYVISGSHKSEVILHYGPNHQQFCDQAGVDQTRLRKAGPIELERGRPCKHCTNQIDLKGQEQSTRAQRLLKRMAQDD